MDIHSEGFNQVKGNGQKDSDGGQIDGEEGPIRTGGCGGGSRLNLNLNSDSLSPRGVGHHRDYHSEADMPLMMGDANQGVCAAEDLIEGSGDRVLERAPLIAAEAEGVELQNMDLDATSQVSGTKTKTAQLSENGYSEEVLKIKQLLHPQNQITPVAGFEDDVDQSNIRHAQTESVDSFPPGFEGQAGKKGIVGGKGKAKGRQANPGEDRRVTRSQLRKTRTQVAGRRSKVTSFNLSRRQSIETTESMKQLAEEALRVGELLGVKVISHRDNAVKNITDSLKANRVKR